MLKSRHSLVVNYVNDHVIKFRTTRAIIHFCFLKGVSSFDENSWLRTKQFRNIDEHGVLKCLSPQRGWYFFNGLKHSDCEWLLSRMREMIEVNPSLYIGPNCHCLAYEFPHRPGSAKCPIDISKPFYCGSCGEACSGATIDEGIGPYEYGSIHGIHHHYVIESECCQDEIRKWEDGKLAEDKEVKDYWDSVTY